MAHEVIMPKNGMAMEEGKLIRWLKNVGDTVEKDEPLIEIETDKITMEEPAAAGGVLLAKWAEDGETVPVLQTIGWIGAAGEKVPDKPADSGAAAAQAPPAPPAAPTGAAVPPKAAVAAPGQPPSVAPGGAVPATPYAKTLAEQAGLSLHTIPATGRHGEITGADVQGVNATPLAGRVAAGTGVNLGGVSGTGFGGKITKDDVLAAANTLCVPESDVRTPMSGMRKAVARNMERAWAIPVVTQNTRADVTELFSLRGKLNENRAEKLTLNDFVLTAVAKALTMHPEMLVSLDGDDMIRHSRVNLGVAVALDEGLIVPVVMDADRLGIKALSLTVRDLASRARAGGLKPQEYAGATFTVTNLGMYGVETFSPILNPPNAAILGVCAAFDELALVDGSVVQRKKMMLSLTYDHRLLDGATAGKFSMTVRDLLENPVEILL